jgi:MFS transporter, ACS family, tartrate transporter
VSGIVGGPLAGWLLDTEYFGLQGWQSLFILEAIPAMLFAFVLVPWMADSPREAQWLSAEERRFLTEQFEREVAAKASARHYTLWEALADREVLKLCAAYFLWITGFWGFGYWMPTVLQAATGWSNLAVGWTTVVPMGLSLGTMIWVGHHSSKTGEKRWHGSLGLFVAAAGLLLGTTTDNGVLAFLCLCLAAIGVYAPFGVWWSYPTAFLSGAAAAGAIGLINSAGNVGGFVGPYLMGFFKKLTGDYQYGWLYLALSLFCAGLLMLTFRKHDPSADDAVADRQPIDG